MEDMAVYNHLPYLLRTKLFIWRTKFRWVFLIIAVATFNFWGNAFGLLSAKIERTYKKYKKRWITRYNPECITYQSALDTMYEPKALSRGSTERLCELFIRVDREMQHGFSRQLIADALKAMEKLTKEEEGAFMKASGYY